MKKQYLPGFEPPDPPPDRWQILRQQVHEMAERLDMDEALELATYEAFVNFYTWVEAQEWYRDEL